MLSIHSRLLVATALCGVAALVAPSANAQVSTQFVNSQTGTTYTNVNSDCSKLVTFSNGSAVAVTLPQAGTANKFQQGCFIDFENKGAGAVTITPSTSTINGGTTLVLTKNQGARIVSDGTNYQAQLGGGIGQGTASCTVAAALECDAFRGQVTVSATAASHATQSVAFTNKLAGTTSNILCSLNNYTDSVTYTTSGVPAILDCTPTANVVTIRFTNVGSQNMTGSVTLDFLIVS